MTGVQTCALPICFPVTIEGGYSVVVNDILFSVLKIEIDGKEIEFYSSIE